MKKQKLKKYLKLGIILFGISSLLWNCEKGKIIETATEQVQQKKISIRKIYKTEIQKNKEIVFHLDKINKRNLTKEVFAKNVKDTTTGIEINTDFATYLELADGYNSYTFPVTNTPTGEGLQNVLLSLQADGSYKEYLTHYNITDAEIEALNNGNYVDLKDKYSIKPLDSNFATDVFDKVIYQDECLIIEWIVNTCSSGKHVYGQVCYVGGAEPGGKFSITYLNCSSGGSSSDPNDPTGDTTNTGDTSTDPYPSGGGSNLNNDPITSPTSCTRNCIEAVPENPCDKIKKIFTENSNLKQELIDLKTHTSDSVERGKFKLTSSSIIQNTEVGSNGSVKMTKPSSGKYVMMAHTHNSPSNNTYSVFSYDDLIAINTLLKKGDLDASQFVFFVMTADGTNYVLTIDNPNQFLKVFATINDANFNMETAKNRVKKREDYYYNDNGTPPLITENSSDNLKDEKLFLDFLEATNMGLTLFEVDDAFENFEKVTHNKGTDNIDKNNCN